MSDPLDEFFEESEIIEEEQPPRPHNKRRPGGFLNLLSGILVAGTIVVGLLFVIIFINPQNRLNPLPPNTMSAPFLTYTPSSTPKPVLPPIWTPTISQTDTPALTPLPTDTPMAIVENSPTPTADLESGVTFGKQDGSLSSEADTVHTDAGCNWLRGADQFYDIDGVPVNTQLAPPLSQTQVASAETAPIPTEQFLTNALPPDDGISDLFTPEIQYWEEDILAWSEEYGLDPNLIATVMQIESCGYTRAKSAAGAMGLFQVMPQHFKEEEDPYEPDTNAYRGLSWLQKTLKSGGSTSMALAGYNAGIARVKNPYLEWPNETQRYVNWGLQIYQDTRCGYDYSSALHHWLSKGGSSLCNRAAVEQQDQ
ncbi:MAG: transglycosylase SLT domain-containing protein [Deltaproteobacteria bacterium]|nr:transglycosylase SLT domain-containing protein [Deltaproteobacteria bacterium]